MRKHIFAILILIVTTAIAIIAALQHTSATSQDRAYVLANFAIAVVLFVLALTVAIVANVKKRLTVRNYAIVIVIVSALIAATPIVDTAHRLKITKNYLSDTYTQLADNGPPFPKRLPESRDHSLEHLISHGYWVADDQRSFEVYYHDSSDSFTMTYPVGKWEWRGNKYSGPESKQK